jgi:hypothetical protein
LPDFHDEQKHSAREPDGCKHRARKIKAQQERAGCERESRTDSNESRPVAPLLGL